MTEPIRAFIALELPTAVKDYLYQLGQQLGSQLPAHSVKWVQTETMHLTLVFLGDGVTAAQVAEISGRLDQIAAVWPPFHFRLDKLGAFPNPKAPRVIWVGVDGDVKPLQTLKSQLDQALEPLGWQPEKRRYNPHLTLGRVKDSHAIGRAFLPFGKPVQTLEFTATAVHLFSSTLTPQGAQYDIVHTSNFSQ
ncbi:MAG: RNA 2',3'-cyclic phosphodiesterase [Anaerolineales bacterium]|nr:RNA 2',3'-cyclic phosphodiesterase [Anaerolineales bacterium]